MQQMSKTDLSPIELETVKVSRLPTEVACPQHCVAHNHNGQVEAPLEAYLDFS